MSEKIRQNLIELSGEVRAADLHDRVLAGSRRITLRNRALGSAAMVTAVVAVIFGVSVLRPTAQGPVPAESSSPVPTVTESAPPAPSQTPSASPSGPPPPASGFPWNNATFDVPAFPGTPCKSGSYKFVNGAHRVDDQTQLRLDNYMAPAVSNVDGVAGDETLVLIRCAMDSGESWQVLALKVNGERVTTVGFVLDRSDLDLDFAEGIQVADGTVYLEVFTGCHEACPHSEKQRRGYAYVSGGFRQVSGPTSFTPIPAVPLIDPGNTTLALSFSTTAGQAFGYVRMVDGAGQARFRVGDSSATPVKSVRAEVTLGPTARGKREGEDFIAAILTITDESGAARKIGYVFSKATNTPWPLGGTPLVAGGEGGVTDLKAISAGTDVVTVTVTTSGGNQAWTYRPSVSSGTGWSKS
jgi:hypothetical protein